MRRKPSKDKDNFEHLKVTNQLDFPGNSSVNHALTAVAQEVAELIKQAYPVQANSINYTGTIAIRASKLKYKQITNNKNSRRHLRYR